jgi:hypothetical protein
MGSSNDLDRAYSLINKLDFSDQFLREKMSYYEYLYRNEYASP